MPRHNAVASVAAPPDRVLVARGDEPSKFALVALKSEVKRALVQMKFKSHEATRAVEVAAEILSYCIDAGGSLTGEHGIGADKSAYMPQMFSADDLALMQRVRAAFDPDGLCNPGKVFPTPRLCGEVPGPYREHPLEKAGVAERW